MYLNIAGLPILKSSIFSYIEKTKPGKGQEFWLTDAVDKMLQDGHAFFDYVFGGKRYDIGTFESLREADMIEQKEP
jgi:UTP--glucose-1-phosphate uridylyltransferase